MNSLRRFEEMISHVRTYGLFVDPDLNTSKDVLLSLFWEVVGDAELFMFHSEGDTKAIPDVVEDRVLQDAPFKNFSFELYDRPITSPKMQGFGEYSLTIWSIVGHEFEPYNYVFFIYGEYRDKKIVLVTKTKDIEYVCQENFKKISRWEVGMELWNRKIKMGLGPKKYFRKVNRVIHVVPRKLKVAMSSGHKEIIYDHRFSVRGYWRRLSDDSHIGHDRSGEKCIVGFTWVSEYEKGDEDLPKLNKVRVVEKVHPEKSDIKTIKSN